MMVSTKGRYALRVMIDLATQHSDEYISLKSISERQDISMKYLESIVSTLNKAGLIDSQRGKNGGYRLTKNPSEYSIYSILRHTDGTLAPVACLACNTECEREDYCKTRPMWDGLYQVIIGYLESKTLADLMNIDDNGAEIL